MESGRIADSTLNLKNLLVVFPKLDQVDVIESLENKAREFAIKNETTNIVAARLVASLFYFEVAKINYCEVEGRRPACTWPVCPTNGHAMDPI